MGFLQKIETVAAAGRLRAESAIQAHRDAFWSGDPVPDLWLSSLSTAGVAVTPELAMTLSAFYSGVTMISYDLATLPAQMFAMREDGGKDRIRPYFGAGIDSSNGIRSMAYMLRWQPNDYQTATEFWVSMVAQYLLRAKAYAEIVKGRTGFVAQLLPRFPDRVRPERLPSGRLRFRLTEANGQHRYTTQEEMFVIRDAIDGGIDPFSRVAYGANAIGTVLSAERAAAKFFKSGMTAATVATYKGQMEEEDEAALHASISRYAAGAENSFGLMLIPDDVSITTLGVEPEKAQMMAARQMGTREVARLLRLPPHKLAIPGTQTYASQVQSALEYVISCLRPIAVTIEQSIQRDLIIVKDQYFVEFLLAALLRGDFESQANYIEKLIRNRVMRPSEARLSLNMNPDPRLDELSEGDFRPGTSATIQRDRGRGSEDESPEAARPSERARLKATLALHDNALRCLRRERAAIEKLAKKHADEPDLWRAGLREFYADHATFVAQVMRLHPVIARGYAAQHGSELEAKGVGGMTDEWLMYEADELTALALDPERQAA